MCSALSNAGINILTIEAIMLKKKEIAFRGKPAIRGTCQCGKTLIVEKPNPANGGKFQSYHQKPMCAAYLKLINESIEEGKTIEEGEGVIAESEYE